jgi:DNA-binding response OmpR family regulator
MNERPEPSEAPARILIVDDGCENRDLLQVILGWEGFLVRTAASGEEALVDLANEPTDLVLLDVMMPGIDGYEVVTRMRANPATKDIRVIMLSALTDSAARARALSAGADGVLPKPVDRIELVARVKSLLVPAPILPRAAS